MNESKEILPYPPYASLVITGKELDPEEITDILGINPHRRHKKHEKKKDGVREFSMGSWVYSSEKDIESFDVIDHVDWLVDQLLPIKNKLKLVQKMGNINIVISIFWIMSSTNEALSFSPKLLNRMSNIGIEFEFDIFSPRDEL
jgi:hypothetical protein